MKEVLELTSDGKVRVKEKKRSKYGNKRQLYDGMWFDSKAELRRWLDLQKLERAGAIKNLRRQVRYRLEVSGELVTTYVADMTYEERALLKPEQGGSIVWHLRIEDVKGSAATQTPEFKIKAKLMKAIHGIDILITGKGVK